MTAIKLILERIVPAFRPEERQVQLEGFAGDRIELVEAVIAALPPAQSTSAEAGVSSRY